MKQHTIAVVVPALNEDGNIASLVSDLNDVGCVDVIVVDNGSEDHTAVRAEEAGAIVVNEPRRGYGYACAAGFERAERNGATIVVFIDADHSSKVDEVAKLTDPIARGDADLVLGSRVLGHIEGGAMPQHQRFGNWISAGLMRKLYRTKLTDLGPFRAIRVDLLTDLDMTEMTFGWPTEMTVKSLTRDAVVIETPVTWRVRRHGRSKVGGTVKGSVAAGFHITRVMLRNARRR